MTSPTAERLAHLEETIARLEDLIGDGPSPDPLLTNPNGTPGNVAAGELIESAWGNATANSISRLWAYQAPRVVFSGAVTTNANGDFAVSTGFIPQAVFCMGMQTAFPAIFVVRDFPFEAAQVVLRALNPTNLVAYGSATISVTYVIYGPHGNV